MIINNYFNFYIKENKDISLGLIFKRQNDLLGCFIFKKINTSGVFKWENIYTLYLNKLKEVWLPGDINQSDYYLKEFQSEIFIKLSEIPILNEYESFNEVKAYFGEIVCTPSYFLVIRGFKDIWMFLKSKESSKLDTKKQKELDELLLLKHKDYTNEDFNIYEENMAKIEKLNSNTCVIRTFHKYNNLVLEHFRIYITKNKYYICKKRNDDVFVICSSERHRFYWSFYLDDFDISIVNGTMLSYTYDILMETDKNKRVLFILALLKHSIFEKLYKAGYKNICNVCVDFLGGTCFNELKEMFVFNDNYNDNLSVREFTGMNNYQLKKINDIFSNPDYYFAYKNCIPILKFWFRDNLGDLNNSYFNFALDAILLSIENNYYLHLKNIVNHLIQIKSFKFVFNNLRRLYPLLGISSSSYSRWRKYSEYLEILSHPVLIKGDYPIFFNNFNEFELKFKEMNNLYSKIKSDIDEKELLTLSENWNSFLFEDEHYLITYPCTVNDFILESQELHHCAKEYIEPVIRGETIILFLREKEFPSNPFYTIEIQDGYVYQVHGLQNKNIQKTSPEGLFIKKWIKEKGLNMKNFNLLR